MHMPRLPKIDFEPLLSEKARRIMEQPIKPSALTHKPARAGAHETEREPKLVAPARLDGFGVDRDGAIVSDVIWFAVRTAHGCELMVRDELNGNGHRAYCPLGRRRVWYKKTGRKVTVQRPVFTRYAFVGCSMARPLGKRSADKIEAILSDAKGPLRIPAAVIKRINDLELAGEWDEDKAWSEKTLFRPGEEVRIAAGPFAGFQAVFEARTAEERIKLLIDIFGRPTPVAIDPCQVERL